MSRTHARTVPRTQLCIDPEGLLTRARIGRTVPASASASAAVWHMPLFGEAEARKNGAGSLAHEWFHAVDNYFARMRGMKAGFMTDSHAGRGEGVRPEMVNAFRELMGVINRTGMRERSSKLDAKRREGLLVNWTGDGGAIIRELQHRQAARPEQVARLPCQRGQRHPVRDAGRLQIPVDGRDAGDS